MWYLKEEKDQITGCHGAHLSPSTKRLRQERSRSNRVGLKKLKEGEKRRELKVNIRKALESSFLTQRKLPIKILSTASLKLDSMLSYRSFWLPPPSFSKATLCLSISVLHTPLFSYLVYSAISTLLRQSPSQILLHSSLASIGIASRIHKARSSKLIST